MDSHSFRIISEEFAELLDGARLEKIHGPRPGVLAFTIFAKGQKRYVIFRYERQNPLLFLSGQRLDNPSHPPAAVMRLRKYCGGRRLGRAVIDYAARALAFPVPVAPEEEPCWLLLDMVNGAFAVKELPEGFGAAQRWPERAVVDSLCAVPRQKNDSGSFCRDPSSGLLCAPGQDRKSPAPSPKAAPSSSDDKMSHYRKNSLEGVWQEYTVLTPLLRETLAALDPLDGQALLVDLEAGGGELFLYADIEGRPVLYTAWPLPQALCERRSIASYPEEKLQSLTHETYPALTIVACTDEPKFFADLGNAVQKEASAPLRRSTKKQSRLLAKLDQEKKRLTAMMAQREDAVALQEVLWRYPAEARLDSVPVGGENNGPSRCVPLNPLLTVRENMVRMFKESARGARGLAMLEVRRAQVLASEAGLPAPERASEDTAAARALPESNESSEIKNVARFRSSDGFTLLRGKNAKGNQSLLKIGKSHDLWLHAEDGPSAHLIIRRSHAAEEIPERTLREAAILVGEKSWQRHDARARIMVALLRHVHAVKGAAPGTVKVDAVLQTLVVSLVGEDIGVLE